MNITTSDLIKELRKRAIEARERALHPNQTEQWVSYHEQYADSLTSAMSFLMAETPRRTDR